MNHRQSAAKTIEVPEFEFQTSAVMKDPKPQPKVAKDKARPKVVQT